MPESEKKKMFSITKTQAIVAIIVGLIVIGGSVLGLFRNYDSSLVHVPEYTAFKQQVNEQTLQNRIDFYQRVVWDLEKLHDTTDPLKMKDDHEKYRVAAKNLDTATKQLEAIQAMKDKP